MPMSARLERTGYYARDYAVHYRGYTIKTIEHPDRSGHLIDGHMVHHGYVVCDASRFCNVMPGATWFQTVQEAKDAIDDLIATNHEQGRPGDLGDARTEAYPTFKSDPFWGRVRVRQTAQKNALVMASLLKRLSEQGVDLGEDGAAVLTALDRSADTRTTVLDIRTGAETPIGPKGRTGLDYL